MKINIGIDTKNGFCEVVIDSDGTNPVTIRSEDLIRAADEAMAAACGVTTQDKKQVVIDGKAVDTFPCEVPGCNGTVMRLEKRSVCGRCGREYDPVTALRKEHIL